MNLTVALVRIRLNVNVVMVNRKHSSGDGVMATHTVPDLNLLPAIDEPL
jgi:hypothetical protein